MDLLFSDIVMPGVINGIQLAEEARRLQSSLKVLLTSGYTAAVLRDKHDLAKDSGPWKAISPRAIGDEPS